MKMPARKFRKVVAGLLLVATSGAFATTITNSNGTFANFGGFDWASNGTAVAAGFNPTAPTNTFDLTYWSSATSILDTFGNVIGPASAGILLGNYEYTVRAMLNETSTCNTFVGGSCTDATFAINSGSFDIWYSTNVNADQVTGGGITDGILLFSGTIAPQAGGGFNVISGGNATLQATITYTNGAFINPAQSESTATTTLQIGSNVTNWAAPTSMPAGSGGTQALPTGAIALQADANQSFRAVPEPGSLALVGLALLGLASSKRRQQPHQ